MLVVRQYDMTFPVSLEMRNAEVNIIGAQAGRMQLN